MKARVTKDATEQEMLGLRDHLKKQYENLDPKQITVGDFTYGQFGYSSAAGVDCKLKIGKFCSIAAQVKFVLAGDHRVDWNSTYPFNQLVPSAAHIKGHPTIKGDVVVGNDVWLGTDVMVMAGVNIGDGAVVAAGSVVVKDVAPYTIVGGVPAKKIKDRFDAATVAKFEEMQWWEWPLSQISKAMELLQSDDLDGLYAYYQQSVK